MPQPRRTLARRATEAKTGDVELPETHYARSGDLSIAYQVIGKGPPDLIYIPSGFHHVELVAGQPDRSVPSPIGLARPRAPLDKRGTGMSDRLTELPSLDTRMDDIRAVMDAAGSARGSLRRRRWGLPRHGLRGHLSRAHEGTPSFNSAARYTRTPDMPWNRTRAELEALTEDPLGVGRCRRHGGVDEARHPERDRGGASTTGSAQPVEPQPWRAAAYLLPNLDLDVRDVLPAIRVPTLVMYRAGAGYSSPQKNGRYLAEHIPTARLVELPGADLAPAWGDQERLFSELEQFLQETAEGGAPEVDADRVLATVLFSDLVDATAHASKGDRAWRESLQAHHELIRAHLGYSGKGDGHGRRRLLRDLRRSGARDPLRLCDPRQRSRTRSPVRVGLHTGECELVDDKLSGIAVHIERELHRSRNQTRCSSPDGQGSRRRLRNRVGRQGRTRSKVCPDRGTSCSNGGRRDGLILASRVRCRGDRGLRTNLLVGRRGGRGAAELESQPC